MTAQVCMREAQVQFIDLIQDGDKQPVVPRYQQVVVTAEETVTEEDSKY